MVSKHEKQEDVVKQYMSKQLEKVYIISETTDFWAISYPTDTYSVFVKKADITIDI